MAAAKVLYTKPLDPATIAMVALMFGGTVLPALGTFAEHKEKLSPRKKQGVLGLASTSLGAATVLMTMATISSAKESDPAKIALTGMGLFLLSSVFEIPYRTARALNLMGSKLPVELAAVASAFVGACAFLVAQVVSYMQARESNNKDQMNTAILLALTSLGFMISTGYGAAQIVKAMKSSSAESAQGLSDESHASNFFRVSLAQSLVGGAQMPLVP
jgi:hypothetical protein